MSSKPSSTYISCANLFQDFQINLAFFSSFFSFTSSSSTISTFFYKLSRQTHKHFFLLINKTNLLVPKLRLGTTILKLIYKYSPPPPPPSTYTYHPPSPPAPTQWLSWPTLPHSPCLAILLQIALFIITAGGHPLLKLKVIRHTFHRKIYSASISHHMVFQLISWYYGTK